MSKKKLSLPFDLSDLFILAGLGLSSFAVWKLWNEYWAALAAGLFLLACGIAGALRPADTNDGNRN